jgi:hypothetical protein
MKIGYILAIVPAGAALSGSICCADTLQTHRIPDDEHQSGWFALRQVVAADR